MLKKILNIAILMILTVSVAKADDLTATLSQDKVPLGETFELTLTYNGNNAGNVQPDFSPLRQNFDIYSTSSSLQSSFINGQGSVQRQWKIGLMPKQMGVLTIPALKIGQYSSQPLNIQVLPSGSVVSAASSNSGKNSTTSADIGQVALDLSVDEHNPYVQQEINAVLTIDDNKGIEFAAEPQLLSATDDWIIKTLRQPTVEANGKGGRIIKFYYALFPQKSGKQQIPAFQIDGFYTSFEDPQMSSSAFGGMMSFFETDIHRMFGMKKPIKLQTKPVDIDVKPIAGDYGNSWWLPATAVGVASRWTEQKPLFKVGETVSREIVFAAEGVADTQMPEIELAQNTNIRQYPEKPVVESIADNNKITSQVKIRIVYIPQVGGKQTIPAIKIPWFDVTTGKKQTAVIDAVTIDVEGSAMPFKNETATANPLQEENDAVNIPLVEKTVNGFVQWVWLLLAFAAGLLLSFVVLRRRENLQSENKEADMSDIVNSLHQKDYRRLRDCLLAYGRRIYKQSNINNLNDLATCVEDADFSEQMERLNGILYANQMTELDEKSIVSALKKAHKTADKKEHKPLPDLYK